jgi:hypothetical protein
MCEVWGFFSIQLTQDGVGLYDNKCPPLTLKRLCPYGSDKPKILASSPGMTERNGTVAVMFLEGAE